MRAGKLSRRVTFQTVTEWADSTYGGPEPATTALGTRWARIRTLDQSERFAAAQSFGEVTHEVSVRYDATLYAALDSADRMTLGGRTFDLMGPANVDEADVEIRVMAKERR